MAATDGDGNSYSAEVAASRPLRTTGEMLDAMGVGFDLEPGQHIVEVVIVAKLADFNDDTTALAMSSSTDWVAQLGMLVAAKGVIESSI